MTSSAAIDDPLAPVRALAERLCGGGVTTVEPIRGGHNNRLYRIARGEERYALKLYALPGNDDRRRLDAEFGGLRFLEAHGFTDTPRAMTQDRQAGAALYEWIDGTAIARPDAADIAAAVDFAAALRWAAREPDAGTIGAATEACLSAAELITQVERRQRRLLEVAPTDDRLRAFLGGAFGPFLEEARRRAEAGYATAGWSFGDDIPLAKRTLSPSDFGFHNALRREDGRIVFLDFEYFGWDDPVRLVSDFLLHPGMALDAEARRQFAERALPVFDGDADFRRRLTLLFPLVGLRWCMILLNEFLPERWQRRAFAGARDVEAAKDRQLAKAQALLDTLLAKDGGFPVVD